LRFVITKIEVKGGNKMETKQIWVLVLGALVIAIVASVISASITGNIVKTNTLKVMPSTSRNAIEIYSKAEIDAKINNILNCHIVYPSLYGENGQKNCEYDYPGSKCIFSEITGVGYAKNISFLDWNAYDETEVGPKDFFVYPFIADCGKTKEHWQEEFNEVNSESRLRVYSEGMFYLCCSGAGATDRSVAKAISNADKKKKILPIEITATA
jgi:hypothetical protein